jgi:hypothetical protein
MRRASLQVDLCLARLWLVESSPAPRTEGSFSATRARGDIFSARVGLSNAPDETMEQLDLCIVQLRDIPPPAPATDL